MKEKLTYEMLTPEEKARVNRLLEISSEKGIKVAISIDRTCVVLVGPNGEKEASSPISDFLCHEPQ